MARRLNGTSEELIFSGGSAINEIHTWGMVAALFKRTSAGGVWRCPIYSGNGGASNWGLSLDINTGNTIWFGIGSGQAEGSFAMNATDRWYLVVVRKASGNVQPLSSVWNSSTGTWNHQNLTAFANGSGAPTVSQVRLGSFGGFDHFAGDIAAAGIWHGYAPSNAALEALGLHTSAQAWIDSAANATLGAGIWIPSDTATSVALQDLTGNGANETSSNVGSVVDDPVGWNDLSSGGDPIDLEAALNSVSSFTADLLVEADLEASVDSVSSFTASLRVEKLLSSSINSESDFLADLELANEFDALFDTVSTFTAQLEVGKELSASIASVSDFEASMLNVVLLEASIASVSTITAEIPLVNLLEASINSITSLAGALHVEKGLEASISSTSDFRARLDIGQQTPFNPRFQVVVWGKNRWFDPQFESIGV